MLPSAHRLRRGEDFSTAVKHGRRAGRSTLVGHLVLAVDAPSVDSPARAGFVVSRAVGNAVTRNAVTRRLRHLMRARLDRLPKGSVLVVRALPPSAGAPSSTLEADLDRVLGRLLPESEPLDEPRGEAVRA